jgi:hypothetical protein
MHKACHLCSGNCLPILGLKEWEEKLPAEKKKRTPRGAFSYLAEAVGLLLYEFTCLFLSKLYIFIIINQ